jgi:hypothetical protein
VILARSSDSLDLQNNRYVLRGITACRESFHVRHAHLIDDSVDGLVGEVPPED